MLLEQFWQSNVAYTGVNKASETRTSSFTGHVQECDGLTKQMPRTNTLLLAILLYYMSPEHSHLCIKVVLEWLCVQH